MSNTVLEIRNLSKSFGGLQALNNVSFEINQGEIVALIGPNGAGKTTFFNCITGIYKPNDGEVTLHCKEGKDNTLNIRSIVGIKPYQITKFGMARTFQNIRLFPTMTVLENIMIGRHCRTKTGVLGAIFRTKFVKKEEQETVDRAYALLKSVDLHTQANEEARNLSYGAQRRLEIARALATDPFILLLDEPAAGMNMQETMTLKSLILDIREQYKLSILLIEHDMSMVMSLSDRIVVMEYGSCIAKGTPQEIQQNERVIKAYLGESNA